MFITTDHFDHK